MIEKIWTATEKTYDCDYCVTIPNPEQAYIRILNTPISTVASVFSDENETAYMTYCGETLSGYTKLIAIMPEDDAVKVMLARR